MSDNTNNLDITAGGMQMQQRQLTMPEEADLQQQYMPTAGGMQMQQAQDMAMMTQCPNCGAEIDIDTDYCEACHIYIKRDTCSFCGAHLTGMEGFCPDCGNPLGGIVCPTCYTMNDFAFCKQCGTALTDEAKAMLEQVQKMPEHQKLKQLVKEWIELEKIIPYTSEKDKEKERQNNELRRRVLTLLAEDTGISAPSINPLKSKRIPNNVLKKQKTDLLMELSKALAKLETMPTAKPSQARNFAMATKPAGVKLGWVCNYKHALHSSPCGCAKPQMGGKWVVLGKNDDDKIKDDK